MSEIKRMSINEFHEKGFLQEVNRQFFHPLGLALEIIIDDEGNKSLGGIWDFRDDPEGMFFAENPDPIKVANVKALHDEKAVVRMKQYGYVIQPEKSDCHE